MAQVYNRLQIDVHKEVREIITAVQNDANSRFLDVVLLDNGTAINLTGHEVRIYGVKGDGTELFNNGEITNATTGRCQFELTAQALAVAQDLNVQLIIYKNNIEILSTQPFRIHVVKSLISAGAVESSNEYGALVVLYQNLYEAYDLMTTMVQNIGVPKEIAEQLSIETMWEAWEYLCNYVSEDLTTLLQNAINNNSVDGVVQRLGNTADTGGTATTGTVMGKLNKLMTSEKYLSFKTLTIGLASNKTDFELLSITGAGEFYALNGFFLAVNSVKMIIDGVTYVSEGNYGTYCTYKPSTHGLTSLPESGSNLSPLSLRQVAVATFKESLKIIVDTSNSVTTARVAYALYE